MNDRRASEYGILVYTMTDSPESNLTSKAILVHDKQAQRFARWHASLNEGHAFTDTFVFGRSRLMKILDAWLPPTSTPAELLDVGCGTGHDLQHWASRGYSCAGVEPAQGMIEIARRLNPGLAIEQASIFQLPFEDGRFDVVVAIELVRYLDDLRPALAEVFRVLKPEGSFIFTATAPYSLTLYPLINQVSGRIQVPTLTRLLQHFHSPRRLRRILADMGGEILEIRGAGFVTPFHRMGDRMLPVKYMQPLYRWGAQVEDALGRQQGLAGFSQHMAIRARKRTHQR